MKRLLIPWFLLSIFFLEQTTPALALTSKEYLNKKSRISSGRSVSDFEDSSLQRVRLMQWKQELEQLEEGAKVAQGPGISGEASVNGDPASSDEESFLIEAIAANPDAELISNWFNQNQAASPLGLVASYPSDPALANQAFTYDQALAGLLMLKEGNIQGALKIFNFYQAQWDGTGFWTVYHTQDLAGSKIEYEKLLGPNAWIGLFALHYHSLTGDSRGLSLATQVGKWIQSLPHRDGGVDMGSNFFWSTKFSVESNLDDYALLNILSTKAASRSDRRLFSGELSRVKNWLKTQGYDSSAGLFKRGAYGDTVKSLDTNSWAVLALGPDTLKRDFGIDFEGLVARTEAVFAVQTDGSFGQNTLTAKGFDFSDVVNASIIGRSGLNWVEGTNQMVELYRELSDYYSQKKNKNAAKASFYRTRADYFSALNIGNSVSQENALSYVYTDLPGAQIFSDNPYWKSAAGSSVASSAWVYYSLYGFNPFKELVTSSTIVSSAPVVTGAGRPGGPKPPPPTTYPNDPYYYSTGSWGQSYADLWGIKQIGLDASVWDLYKGEGIKIGVVDTGILYAHEDMASNIWTNPFEISGNGQDDDNNGYIDDVRGWDFVGNDNDATDLNGHGTHVAGILAGVGNNSKGVIGVAPLAEVIPVRVLNSSGSGTIEAVAKGIEYAARLGANIINLSLGAFNLGSGSLSLLQSAVDFARSLGSILVAAAGNSNADVDGFSPANLEGVLSVGATDPLDQRASFSNYGSKLFITAPGTNILSLGIRKTHIGTAVSSNYYRASGTSMAAPFVSGAIALLLNKYPGASLDFIESQLAGGALDLGDAGWDPYYGVGRLNIAASLSFTGGTVSSLESSSSDPGVGEPSSTSFSTIIQTGSETATFDSIVRKRKEDEELIFSPLSLGLTR